MITRLLLGFIAVAVGVGAQGVTLGTLSSGILGTSSTHDLAPGEFVIDPFFQVALTSARFFRPVTFTGLNVGETLEWTIDASNEPSFDFLQQQLGNGQDQLLEACYVRGPTTTCSGSRESSVFREVLLSGEVDLTSYVLTSITMSVTDIVFEPWDGNLTWMYWDLEYRFEGHPVPLPGALWLFGSAIGWLVLTRRGVRA